MKKGEFLRISARTAKEDGHYTLEVTSKCSDEMMKEVIQSLCEKHDLIAIPLSSPLIKSSMGIVVSVAIPSDEESSDSTSSTETSQDSEE